MNGRLPRNSQAIRAELRAAYCPDLDMPYLNALTEFERTIGHKVGIKYISAVAPDSEIRARAIQLADGEKPQELIRN